MTLTPTQAKVLKVAKKLCGSPPGTVTPAAFNKMIKKLGFSYDYLHEHLRALNYSRPRSPPPELINEIIAFYYKKANRARKESDGPRKVKKLQQEFLAVIAAEYRKIGRAPINWREIVVRACKIRPKLPPWPRISYGRFAVSRGEALAAARKICGESTLVTPAQFRRLLKITRASKNGLRLHLAAAGYRQPQRPEKADAILKFYCRQARQAETQEEANSFKEAAQVKLAAAYQAIGRPAPGWRCLRQFLNELGLPWPRRPTGARLEKIRSLEPENDLWQP